MNSQNKNLEPDAWRTFDGEGGYDYRGYEDNEDYQESWNRRNPNHVGWVEALYTHPSKLHEENRKLKTVMIAAAEEIAKHWGAHCDHEGYGPVNLLNRLERGIATEYGYKAGRFLQLESQNKELFECLKEVVVAADGGGWSVLDPGLKRARAAIAKCERT